jgi:hypothetical protein
MQNINVNAMREMKKKEIGNKKGIIDILSAPAPYTTASSISIHVLGNRK